MRTLVIAVTASVAMHLLLLVLANRAEGPRQRRAAMVAVHMVKAPRPTPEAKPPLPPPTPVRVTRALPTHLKKPAPFKPPTTAPAVPPPPPQGFSVATKATVAESSVAVPAKENGGNAFADPSNGLPPADKVVTRPPPPPAPIEPAQWLTDAVDRSPPYPAAALRSGISGQVLLRVCVAPTGDVESVTVLKKLGFGCDEAAMEWAKKRWHFKPARRGGEAVSTCMLQPMRFRLEHQ